MGAPEPSAGCGKTNVPPAGNQTIDVGGTLRQYTTVRPADYDPMKPYRLVFVWHELGGNPMQIAAGSFFGLSGGNRWGSEAIFIAGQGLPMTPDVPSSATGWSNTGGRDVAFVRELVDWASSAYCIDRSRIFSTGIGQGGFLSNTLGCDMGDTFRAIAAIAGSGPQVPGSGMCVGQVAVWLTHGDMDTVVTLASGQASRDHWVRSNHCTMDSAPVAPEMCIAFQGCDAGQPVHWCQFTGGHTVPSFAGPAIFDFFSQF
jgi:poly(3-hydroxybutyrate) depolymerase